MAGSWTDWLWEATQEIYAAILDHPFPTSLTTGDLSADRFEYHVAQSAHHLRSQVRTLAVIAAKAPSHDSAGLLAGFAAETATVEHVLHETLVPALELDPATIRAIPVSPTTRAYANHLLATAHTGSFAEGLAAVLPCYWIYQRVGRTLTETGSPDTRYQRWINTYGGADFDRTVTDLLAVADLIGPELPGPEAWRTREHFIVSARYEWMLWDAAWRLETWPV